MKCFSFGRCCVILIIVRIGALGCFRPTTHFAPIRVGLVPVQTGPLAWLSVVIWGVRLVNTCTLLLAWIFDSIWHRFVATQWGFTDVTVRLGPTDLIQRLRTVSAQVDARRVSATGCVCLILIARVRAVAWVCPAMRVCLLLRTDYVGRPWHPRLFVASSWIVLESCMIRILRCETVLVCGCRPVDEVPLRGAKFGQPPTTGWGNRGPGREEVPLVAIAARENF